MTRSLKTHIAGALLVLALASSNLFAADGVLGKLHLESAKLSEIQKTYTKAMDGYLSASEDLTKKLDRAYAQNNARLYYQTLEQLHQIEAPSLSQEESEKLVERMMGSKSEEEKKLWSDWLYENDPYYRPTLTLTLKNEGKRGSYSYQQTISVKPGESVKLPTIEYASDKGVFVGWGITPDSVTYQAGSTIKMPYADQKLYAVFQNGVRFSDPVSGYESFVADGKAKAPVLNAPDASYLFDGWYDQEGNKLEEGREQMEKNGSASYTAFWKSIAFSGVKTRYYKDMTIPRMEQVPLSFTIKNQGNEAISGIKVSLEMEGVTNLSGDLSCRYLQSGSVKNGIFVIVADGESGDVKEGKITLTDGDGDTWSIPVSITIK